MRDFFYNGERYHDPTAGVAMSAAEKERKMDVKAGEVITFTRANSAFEDVPFAILGVTGPVLTGVRLFDTPVGDAVEIICRGKMYAQPEKLEWVNCLRADICFVRTMKAEEYAAIREAVARSLSLDTPAQVEYVEPEDEDADDIHVEAIRIAEETAHAVIRERARAEVYKEMYETLLQKVIGEAE